MKYCIDTKCEMMLIDFHQLKLSNVLVCCIQSKLSL